MMETWQHFYDWMDPVALAIGPLTLRWYGLMYVTALVVGFFAGRWLVTKDRYPLSKEQYDLAFIWVEVGVILGARLGYVLFYDERALWYLGHPWEIFNPFQGGHFVGISGLSYHGAIVGFLVASWLFTRRHRIRFWLFMDLAVLASAAGYGFGRIGNFLNERLIGRETDVPWGVFNDGVLRHPATLYEALLEGFAVFILLFLFRRFKTFDGQLAALYGMLYSAARFTCEFWRRPDPQLGFLLFDWVTMGQILSFVLFFVSLGFYIWLRGRPRLER